MTGLTLSTVTCAYCRSDCPRPHNGYLHQPSAGAPSVPRTHTTCGPCEARRLRVSELDMRRLAIAMIRQAVTDAAYSTEDTRREALQWLLCHAPAFAAPLLRGFMPERQQWES